MYKFSQLLIVISLIVLGSCSLLSSDDTTSIEWEEEDLSEYVLYAYPSEKVAIIDVQSGEVLKILDDFEERIRSLITNENGNILYVSTAGGHAGTNPGKIYRIDTESWTREVIYEQAAYLLESKGGYVFFINRDNTNQKRELGKINDQTGKVSIIDSLNVYWSLRDCQFVEFDSNRSKMYVRDNNHGLYRYDYSTREVDYIFDQVDISPFPHMFLSFDGSRLFIPGGPVLNLDNERVEGSIPVWHFGMTAIRRDMKEVYITDPGGYLRDPRPSGEITVYSPEEDRITGHIQIVVDDPYYNPGTQFLTDLIFLTENERYAIVSNWGRTYFVIDLKTRKVIHFATYTPDEFPNLYTSLIFLSKKPPGL